MHWHVWCRVALVQRSVGALAHLARHPERGGAVTEAVVDARLRDVGHGWVCGGLGECAGGVWRRAVVCQSARRPLRSSAAESARLSVCSCQSAMAGEAALLLGGWARVVGKRSHLASCRSRYCGRVAAPPPRFPSRTPRTASVRGSRTCSLTPSCQPRAGAAAAPPRAGRVVPGGRTPDATLRLHPVHTDSSSGPASDAS